MIDCICSTHNGDLCHPVLPTPEHHITDQSARFKYVDDLVNAQVIKLSDLKLIPYELERPVNYRDRTHHYLPNEKNHPTKG